MNKLINYSIVILANFASIYCNTANDARMLGVSNAYTNMSTGYSCVGINPANLAFSPTFTMDFGSLSFGVRNNSFSFKNITDINGSNMVDSTSLNYYNKNDLRELISDKGLIITSELNTILPGVNFSINNYAFTSKTNSFFEFGAPNLWLDFIFFGNNVGEKVNFNIPYTTQIIQETGFSYANEYKNIYYGFTVKHLLGLLHSDIYAVDSTYFLTDTSSFIFQGSYLLRQGIGGNGFAADFGIITKEFSDGYQLGLSIINLFGSVNWSNNRFFRPFAEDIIYAFIPEELQLRPNEYRYYHFLIDSLTAETLASESVEDIVSSDVYSVIKVDNLNQVDAFNYDSDLVVQLSDSSGYLVPSSEMSDGFVEQYTKSNEFITDYPTLLRMGISRKLLDDAIVECDFMTSFTNNKGSSSRWQMNFGTEVNRFPDYPIRFGFMINNTGTGISIGSGIHKKRINYDYAFSLYDGVTFSTAKGLKFAMGISWK